MAQMIRPVSDLRNNFADISKTVHETKKPVFLTKNGFGDMVVLSIRESHQYIDYSFLRVSFFYQHCRKQSVELFSYHD